MNLMVIGAGLMTLAIGVFIGGAVTGPLTNLQQNIFWLTLMSGFLVWMGGVALNEKKLAFRFPIYAKEEDEK